MAGEPERAVPHGFLFVFRATIGAIHGFGRCEEDEWTQMAAALRSGGAVYFQLSIDRGSLRRDLYFLVIHVTDPDHLAKDTAHEVAGA